ncbi:MAG TPA: DUF1501 domain-containing protein [Pyrinomonadaceae bacterium]|jgi:uncharacterized protein (DUF1501 family)
MAHSRRDFLRNTACALGGAAMASSLESFGLVGALAQAGAASDYRALVCVFLNGGNDCNNTVVDLGQLAGGDARTGYNNVRGSAGLAIAQPSLLPVSPQGGGSYGLHPSMPELQSLFNQSRLAVVCNTGPLVEPLTRATYLNGSGKRPLQLFSHSDQIGLWQSAVADSVAQTGWGGRMADRTGTLNGAAAFPQVVTIAGISLFVTGVNARPLAIGDSNTALGNVLPLQMTGADANNSARRAAFDQIRALDANLTLVRAAADTRSGALAARTALQSVSPVISTAFPNTSLGRQLLQVARVVKASTDPAAGINMKRQIFFCNLGGFDTHSNQLTGQAGLLQQLSQALNAFYSATVELGLQDKVTAFTLSDFGRTFAPSGAGAGVVGSDHGWGSHHFVLGGAVAGGRFYGAYPTLQLGGPDDTDGGSTPRGRWIPTTSVEQYAATLAGWYGLSQADFPAVFPLLGRFATPNVGFMS